MGFQCRAAFTPARAVRSRPVPNETMIKDSGRCGFIDEAPINSRRGLFAAVASFLLKITGAKQRGREYRWGGETRKKNVREGVEHASRVSSLFPYFEIMIEDPFVGNI